VRASRRIHAADQFGEELAVEIRQQHADRLRAPRDQAARTGVRDVVQLVGDLDDAFAGRLGDAFVTIEGARNRRDGDAGGTGDIFDRYGHNHPGYVTKALVRLDVNVYIVRFSLGVVMLRYSSLGVGRFAWLRGTPGVGRH